MSAAAMVLALALEAVLGWPEVATRRIGHPVIWIGRLISMLDHAWNRGAEAMRLAAGALTVGAILAAAVLPAVLLEALLPGGALGLLLTAVIAAPLFATRSLVDHVSAVAQPLGHGNIHEARRAVSMIVGRDPAALDGPGIARAALESLGENASDGIIAPLFWGALLGLPGLFGYKAINTMDSTIGYRTPRHAAFGRVAARLDDVANWVPARLTALAYALVSGRPLAVLAVVRADAGHHRSPNAGWPEAALAAAVGCRLSGPRSYAGRVEDHPWVNGAASDPDPSTLRHGLTVTWRMVALSGVLTLMLGAAL